MAPPSATCHLPDSRHALFDRAAGCRSEVVCRTGIAIERWLQDLCFALRAWHFPSRAALQTMSFGLHETVIKLQHCNYRAIIVVGRGGRDGSIGGPFVAPFRLPPDHHSRK
jgi:hypothetical protein